MHSRWKLSAILGVCLLAVMLSGCGLSPEEQTATAVALTAAAATSTPTITPTITPSPLPPTPTASPTPFGGASGIAFTSNRDGNYEIYLMNPDGSSITQLTDSGIGSYFPEFSPNGDRILYWNGNLAMSPPILELRIMRPDSLDDWSFGPGLGWATWSPDGVEIALVWISDAENLDILRAGRGDPTWLTNDPSDDREPDWSPDGETIAFTSYRDGDPHIYLMDVDGSNQRRLMSTNIVQFEPDWSPDGAMIAFVSGNNVTTQIFIVDRDGSNLRQLTDSAGYNENPSWSPDGKMLAFWSNRTGNREIFIIGIDGAGLTQITHDPADDENPSWGQ